MGNFSSNEKGIMSSAGYKQTSDPDVWKKDNHTITRRSETTIFNTDRNTKNGAELSNTNFKKKTY